MTLEQYWTILVKWWRLIPICFVLVGLGAYLGSKLMTPLYQSSALVQVTIRSSTNNQADYNSLLASDELVGTEAQLATSDTVLSAVASNYPGLTSQALAKEVTAASKLNTQLIEIDVLDASPTRAAALANDIATTLIKQQLQATQLANSGSQQQLQQDLDATQMQITAINNKIAALNAKGGNQAQIAALQIQLNGLQQHYNEWQTALAQLELTQAQDADFLRVAQVAEPNPKSVQPNVLLNTSVGLLAGLLLGMLLAVLYEQVDTRVRTPEALAQLLDWPVLATIWQATSKEDIINPTGHNANVESYRILRTNVGFSAIDKPLHTLVVTSPTPRDGKSTVAANLAIFMAKAGKSTILIDADLRRPTQHERFGIPTHSMGFSNAILASSELNTSHPPAYRPPSTLTTATVSPLGRPALTGISLDPFVRAVEIPNLCVMPSGPLPPNPPELLDSKAMGRLLEALSDSSVEVVIFDAPPLLGLSDTSILASKTNGTLVVFDINHVKKGDLRQVKAMLEQAGVRIIGSVVNKQRRRRDDKLYSYYYQYGANEQKGRRNRGKGNAHSVAVLPVTPDTSKQVSTHSQKKVDTPSQPDLSDMNTIKITSTYSVQPETRPDLLDWRQGG